MKTTTAHPSNATAGHTPGPSWQAHNTQGVRGWAVAIPHPSGDGSFYAPIVQGLTEQQARLIAASPDMLEALQLDLLFHSRPFCRQSLPEFEAAGYTGTDEPERMRVWLNGKKDRAIARATGGQP